MNKEIEDIIKMLERIENILNIPYKNDSVDVLLSRIDKYCHENGVSTMKFETMCKIGNGSIGKWKSKKYDPTLRTIEKIANATKIPLEQWVCNNDRR